MAKELATKESVTKAADALLARGEVPTLKAVQAVTGGSYSTVKRHLDEWQGAQAHARLAAIVVSEALKAQADALLRNLVDAARTEAAEIAQAEIDRAQAAALSVLHQLHEAEAEIVRLEEAERGAQALLLSVQEAHRELELHAASQAVLAQSRAEELAQRAQEIAGLRRAIEERDRKLAESQVRAGDAATVQTVLSQLQALSQALGRGPTT